MSSFHFWDGRYLEAPPSQLSLPSILLLDQKNSLASKAGICHFLSRFSGIDEKQIFLEKTKEGRPYWKNSFGLDFNYSHTKNIWTVGFTNRGRIGVDIESLNQTRDFQGLAERFFSAKEAQLLAGITSPEKKQEIFLRMWTAKEALVKALGSGLKNKMARIEVDPQTGKIISLPSEFGDLQDWRVEYILSATPWILAVAYQ